MIKSENPDVDIVLFGHSLGSVFARIVLMHNHGLYTKAILSGLPLQSKLLINVGSFVIKPLAPNKTNFLVHLSMFGMFEAVNRMHFKSPGWLSYNEDNQRAFDQDKLCGGNFTNHASYITLQAVKEVHEMERLDAIPYLLISGSDDPVTEYTKTVKQFERVMTKRGIDVTNIIYPKMKHEVLLEKNRQIVFDDVLNYLQQ